MEQGSRHEGLEGGHPARGFLEEAAAEGFSKQGGEHDEGEHRDRRLDPGTDEPPDGETHRQAVKDHREGKGVALRRTFDGMEGHSVEKSVKSEACKAEANLQVQGSRPLSPEQTMRQHGQNRAGKEDSRCRPSEEPQTLGEDMDEEQSGQGNPNESVQCGAGLSTALEEAEEEGPGKQGEDAQGQHGGILMERGPPHEEWPAFNGRGCLYLTVNMRICDCCTLFGL